MLSWYDEGGGSSDGGVVMESRSLLFLQYPSSSDGNILHNSSSVVLFLHGDIFVSRDQNKEFRIKSINAYVERTKN